MASRICSGAVVAAVAVAVAAAAVNVAKAIKVAMMTM